jgi:hypothetical protein
MSFWWFCFVIFRAKGFEQKYLRNTIYFERHFVDFLLCLLHWFRHLGTTLTEKMAFFIFGENSLKLFLISDEKEITYC